MKHILEAEVEQLLHAYLEKLKESDHFITYVVS